MNKRTGIKPIITTCNCGTNVTMEYNGSWHSVDCKCGRNIRQKGGTLIIEFKHTHTQG